MGISLGHLTTKRTGRWVMAYWTLPWWGTLTFEMTRSPEHSGNAEVHILGQTQIEKKGKVLKLDARKPVDGTRGTGKKGEAIPT